MLKPTRYLKRTFPCGSVYVNNLLRRNYYQIEDTNCIYAISSLTQNECRVVTGGTGWAVTMGILKKVPEIYLFDVNKNHWLYYAHSYCDPYLWHDIKKKNIPLPSGKYTGIGKHDLPENGANAIRELYKTIEII